MPHDPFESLRATKLPIRAEDKEDFSNTAIYSMPNQQGLYRRVPREGRNGPKTADGNVLAIIPPENERFCELVRWTAGEVMLRPLLPAMESPISDEPGNPMEKTP